jgi:hypothetical protein
MLSWNVNTHSQEIKVHQFFNITYNTDWKPEESNHSTHKYSYFRLITLLLGSLPSWSRKHVVSKHNTLTNKIRQLLICAEPVVLHDENIMWVNNSRK